MSKAHRGAGTREQVSSGRGECPVCKRTGIKLLYEAEVKGAKVNVCKTCNSTLKKQAAAEKAKEAKAAAANKSEEPSEAPAAPEQA